MFKTKTLAWDLSIKMPNSRDMDVIKFKDRISTIFNDDDNG